MIRVDFNNPQKAAHIYSCCTYVSVISSAIVLSLFRLKLSVFQHYNIQFNNNK